MHEDLARHRVAVLAVPEVVAFDLAIPVQVFADRARYEVVVCAERAGLVPTTSGFALEATCGLEALEAADTVVVPGFAHEHPVPAPVLDALRAAHGRGARIASICTGAFALAAAGLLDGRPATTHWDHAALLADRFPAVRVDPAVIYVDDGDVLTSAGMAAGIDLCLHMLADDHGDAAALDRARRMVVPVHRSGNQAQFTPGAAATADGALAEVMRWAESHLADPVALQDLAARARLSTRTLSRRFVEETGSTPYGWLTARRLAAAARLLERPDVPVDAIAARCGLGSPENLRLHFRRSYGTTPSAYRAAFLGRREEAAV